MAHEITPAGSLRITDGDGDSSLFTRIGDGLIVNATSADQEDKVNLMLTPADLDALLDILPADVIAGRRRSEAVTMDHAKIIARKIVRQKERRAAELAQTPGGALDLAAKASRVAHIDGRIDGLTEALEVILDVETVTYDVIERLTRES